MFNRYHVLMALALLSMAGATGVGCGEAPKKPAAAQAAKSGAGGVSGAAQAQAAEEGAAEEKKFEYAGVVDPFEEVSFNIVEDDTTGEMCGVICQMDLTQLVLRGVIFDIDKPRALVEDDQGNGYILAKGDQIGNKKGRVIEISENQIVVLEKYTTPDDFYVVKVPMKLVSEE